jgi:hypothetical protein
MKTQLKLTTAIVAVGLLSAGGGVEAAERLSLQVGGYMEQFVGYVAHDDDNSSVDYDGIDVKSDTETHFTGSTKLDNGIEFGVNVQLEGNSSGDQIDESYMIIKGAFGEINIGDENSAMYKMQKSVAQFGTGNEDGDHIAFIVGDDTSISDSGISRAPFG